MIAFYFNTTTTMAKKKSKIVTSRLTHACFLFKFKFNLRLNRIKLLLQSYQNDYRNVAKIKKLFYVHGIF